MKKKNAFTLIELLAVIVVLAIIALIATPIVMNTIKSAKKGAAERSADSYIRQVETAVAEARLNHKTVPDGTYQIDEEGNLTGSLLPDGKLKIEMNGKKPTSGTITIKNGQVTTDSTMTIGEYDVSYDEAEKKYTAIKLETYSITYDLSNVTGASSNGSSITTKGVKTLKFTADSGYSLPDNVTISGATYVWDKATGTLILSKITGEVTVMVKGAKIYSNGEGVYFNVDTGEKCSSSDYVETQSSTGVKEGCMKFYAFNDNDGNTINLILDHNTTAKVAWNNTYKDDSGTNINAKGPKEVLDQLKSDTSSWKGTETPANYTMDQASQTSKASYTIDYSEYKARLITANEIAQITGNTKWNEKNASGTYYFDTNTSTQSTTCTSGNTTECQYGWLYDRTSQTCTTYGCLNNSNGVTAGYWTASSCADRSSSAWLVHDFGSVYSFAFNISSAHWGVRPVITVLKSKLS